MMSEDELHMNPPHLHLILQISAGYPKIVNSSGGYLADICFSFSK